MSRYIIGDVQGCFCELKQLLKRIDFNPDQDQLWFAGDLVNRGGQDLACLRFIYAHQNCMFSVLGNHDLHLLACFYGVNTVRPADTIGEVLVAPDAKQLIDWLRQQPLFHYFDDANLLLSHAGLYPGWNRRTALALSAEIQAILIGPEQQLIENLRYMYDSKTTAWQSELEGPVRFRTIIDHCTRMRVLKTDLTNDYSQKTNLDSLPAARFPWFNHPRPLPQQEHLAFGHWSALEGKIPAHTNGPFNVFALDSGCVWGNALSCLDLDTHTLHQVSSQRKS